MKKLGKKSTAIVAYLIDQLGKKPYTTVSQSRKDIDISLHGTNILTTGGMASDYSITDGITFVNILVVDNRKGKPEGKGLAVYPYHFRSPAHKAAKASVLIEDGQMIRLYKQLQESHTYRARFWLGGLDKYGF